MSDLSSHSFVVEFYSVQSGFTHPSTESFTHSIYSHSMLTCTRHCPRNLE